MRKSIAMVVAVVAGSGLAVAASEAVSGDALVGGSAAGGSRPGTLLSLPGLGSLSWDCDDRRRVTAAFVAARPLRTRRVTLEGDGRPLSAATLGARTRRLAAPLGRWRTLTFHVVEVTKPASVGATLGVRFRVLPPPTRDCLVPELRATVRTRSHAVGAD